MKSLLRLLQNNVFGTDNKTLNYEMIRRGKSFYGLSLFCSNRSLKMIHTTIIYVQSSTPLYQYIISEVKVDLKFVKGVDLMSRRRVRGEMENERATMICKCYEVGVEEEDTDEQHDECNKCKHHRRQNFRSRSRRRKHKNNHRR